MGSSKNIAIILLTLIFSFISVNTHSKAEANPDVINGLMQTLRKKCEPIPVIPDNRKELKALMKKHGLRKLDSYGETVIDIIKSDPDAAKDANFKEFLTDKNQLFLMFVIDIMRYIDSPPNDYVPYIVKAIKENEFNEYSLPEYSSSAIKLLRKIKTKDSRKAILEIQKYAKTQEKTFHNKKDRPPEYYNKQILRKVSLLNLGIETFFGKYNALIGDNDGLHKFAFDSKYGIKTNGNSDGKIDYKESVAALKIIDKINSDEFVNLPDDVYVTIRYHEYEGKSGNAIVVGAKSDKNTPALPIFTPKRAGEIMNIFSNSHQYGNLKGDSFKIINGYNKSDCIVNEKLNLSSNNKSCAIIYWIEDYY